MNNIGIVLLLLVVQAIYAVKYSNCKAGKKLIIKLNNETARENYVLKKKFGLLTKEDMASNRK